MPKIDLLYAGQVGAAGFGWATCNNALTRHLADVCNLHTIPPDTECKDTRYWMTWRHFRGVVFMPLADHDFNPVSPVRSLGVNVAYTFFESELGPKAAENAKQYDIVFCGSTWCLERMKERGITNGQVLIQGVDHDIFKPLGVPRGKEFRIFSGGKFEYRKGQDIVIAAFKQLLQRHGNVRLVTAWHNPWPQLVWDGVGKARKNLELENVTMGHDTQEGLLGLVMDHMQIPKWSYEMHGPLSQPELARVMNSTDLGVFPNRCEGGTNLVLMEYMACGKPVVASYATGHRDVLSFNWISDCKIEPTENGWWEADPIDVADCIEEQLQDAQNRDACGTMAEQAMRQFTWARAARQIVDAIEGLK